MTNYPVFSPADALAPYRMYQAKAKLRVNAGSVSMPLAYKRTAPGQSALPTSRVLQLSQPNSVIVVEWSGVRVGDKPQPVLIGNPGNYTLAAAGADIDSVGIDSDGREVVAASGYLVLITAERPENIVMPSLLSPWDGRYGNGTIDFAYTYTPAELGFGQLLPGYVAPVTSLKHGTGNPVAQPNTGNTFMM